MRARSVSIGREAVKQETDPYLRQQYTNHDDEMICQICQTKLPFQLANGSKPELKELFSNLVDGRMPVSLAGQTKTIYFTQTHLNDLRVAIESDKAQPKT